MNGRMQRSGPARLAARFLLVAIVTWAAAIVARAAVWERFPTASAAEARFREARGLEAGDPGAAVAIYRELLAAGFEPADAAHAALGRLLPPDEGAPHWRAVAEASPPSPFLPEALAFLAEAAAAEGRHAEAAAHYARLEEVAPDEDWEVRALVGQLAALGSAGRRAEALRVAERLWVEFAHRPESRQAEPVLAAAGRGDPFKPVAGERIFARGTLLLDRGRRDEAVATLRELRRRLIPGSRIEPELDLTLGKALYFLRRYDEALEPLGRAARDPRTEEEARFYRARCLFGLDRGDEGAPDLVRLAERYPRSRRAPLYLYQAYRVFEGRRLWDEAARARGRLLAAYPGSAEARDARFNLGWDAFRQGRFDEAARAFAASARGAAPGWQRARGLYWQARALEAAGDGPAAAAARKILVDEHPLGYYALLAAHWEDTGSPEGWALPDPRRPVSGALPYWPPALEDLQAAGRPGMYLRLGLDEAARRLLARAPARGEAAARLRYWAGDYAGAVRAASRGWADWPPTGEPDPLSAEGLAFPVAFPEEAAGAAAEAGIHPHLLLALAHTESHFDPKAYSPWEARGLTQFIPSTAGVVARRLGVDPFEPEDLFDPALALRFGARHLRDLLDRFGGDLVAAVAAYNAGAAAVERWRKRWAGEPLDVFVESIPYRETRRYVKKVLTALDAYDRLDPERALLGRPQISSGGPSP
ncbi:lytic transglycosylase domain-containing protein [Deferrisoma sp.]